MRHVALYQSTPCNAFYDTSSKPQVSFVNAVLRKINQEGSELLKNTTILDNVNPYLINQWVESYGVETTDSIVESSMKQSPVFVTVNCAPTTANLSEDGGKIQKYQHLFSLGSVAEGGEAVVLPTGSIRVPEQTTPLVSRWPGYSEGDWWVQDPSATLPALALYNALRSGSQSLEDFHVVDLCSAPGGKTAQLCTMGFGLVTAVEISPRRTKQLSENLKRLRLEEKCRVLVADGRHFFPQDEERVDAVLLDAPCSATGVASRRPDVLRKPLNLNELHTVQRELVVHTVDNLLSVGSLMIYATCSLLKSESEDQMEWLLARKEGNKMETVPFQIGEIPGFDGAIDENGWIRVVPGQLESTLADCDGFFVCRMKRVE